MGPNPTRWPPHEKRRLGHRRIQKENHVKRQREKMAPRKPGGEARDRPFPHSPQKEADADLLILNFQNSEKTNLCFSATWSMAPCSGSPGRLLRVSSAVYPPPPTLCGEEPRTSSNHVGTLGRTPSPAVPWDDPQTRPHKGPRARTERLNCFQTPGPQTP